MNELRPCPLCPIDEANPPQLFSISGLGFMSYVQCPICILETKRYGTRAEAVAAWNHRPVEDALVKAIDDYRWAATFSPSCQKGVVENCRCLKCASERLDAALKMAKEGR